MEEKEQKSRNKNPKHCSFMYGFVILSNFLVAFKSQVYFLFIRPLHHHQLQMLKTNYRIWIGQLLLRFFAYHDKEWKWLSYKFLV